MSNTNTGGPAFPYGTAYAGMTLRDYFAAKAMEAFLHDGSSEVDEVAEAAYIVANAMLKAREK
jgi:hypothetical protein